MATCHLTADRLRELLDYNPNTGAFTRRIRRGAQPPGALAGTVNGKGYRQVFIDGKIYLEHRLAWLYVHGRWPQDDVDHINCVKSDNRIANLRDVPNEINAQNVRRARKTHGPLGCTFDKKVGKWMAQIKLHGNVCKYLGYFDDPDDAHAAYLDAKRKLHDGCTI